MCFREVRNRYSKTEKGRAAKAKYAATAKCKATHARYNDSAKGHDRSTRYKQSPQGWLQALVTRRQKALNRKQRRQEAEDLG